MYMDVEKDAMLSVNFWHDAMHHVNFLDHLLPPWIFALSPVVAALPYIHNFETFDFVSQLFLEVFMAPETLCFSCIKAFM
jgi:hypothetical protein